MIAHKEDLRSHSWDFDPAQKQAALLTAWQNFMQEGKIDSHIVRECIAESWLRSRNLGVDPNRILPSSQLDHRAYRKQIAKANQLINLASPILENLFDSFGGSRYIVSLYDVDGYHLVRLAQPEDLRVREKHGLQLGVCYDEHSLGTTGFSLAKRLKQPVRMSGCEHYNSILHHISGVYAPIPHPKSKKILGVIAVGGKVLIEYPHAESIVVAASTAIENLIELDEAKREMAIYSESLQIAIDSLEDGVIVVGYDGRIREVNRAARHAIDFDYYAHQTAQLAEIPHCLVLAEIVSQLLENPDAKLAQTEFQSKGQLYLVSAKSIKQQFRDAGAVLIQLKNIKTLSKMLYDATVDHPRYRLESIIGSSRAIAEIKSLVQVAARTDAPVIIEGESGTGKELVAQAIHNAGHRKKYPFVDVNCASIPTELIESTIFGHMKGSFTGAIRTHLGKFELAHKGTLFLDEIGDMPNTMQAKMLKAIEDGKIERLGGEKAISVDVRIIAATNRDITALIGQGAFREDLFFRLNVFRIAIPPLRRRIEDIPALADGLIKEFFPQSEKLAPKISKNYLDRLKTHDWPGNVRELRNAIQFSIARLTGDTLKAKHLDHFFHLKTKRISPVPGAGPRNQKLAEITRQVIQAALEEHQGNKSEAARALGISRATLYRKLE